MIVRLSRTPPLMVRVAPEAMVVVPAPDIVPVDQAKVFPAGMLMAPEPLRVPLEKSQSTLSELVFNVRVPLERVIDPVMPRVTGAATVVVAPETRKVPAPLTVPEEMSKVPALSRSVPVLTLTVPALVKGMPTARMPEAVSRVKVLEALLLKALVPPPL